MYGYPELTPQIKADIFGLNAAKLYCVDPSACRYAVDRSLLAQRKRELDGELGPRRWAFEQPAIKTRREFMTLIRRRRALGELARSAACKDDSACSRCWRACSPAAAATNARSPRQGEGEQRACRRGRSRGHAGACVRRKGRRVPSALRNEHLP